MRFTVPNNRKQIPAVTAKADFNFVQSPLTCDHEMQCLLKLAFLSAKLGKRELRN